MINVPIKQIENIKYNAKEYFEKNSSKCDASKYKIYSIQDAKNLFDNKSIYIWGAGQKGRGFFQALKRCGFKVRAFLDSNSKMIGSNYLDVPIIDSNKFLASSGEHLENSFVLTASVDSKNREMFSKLSEHGFTKGKNFESIQTLSPFYPVIEVTGLCNLRCSSCPRADSEMLEVGKYMSASNYKKVITKMVQEIPFLYLVDLYIWGEPLLNKELPEIIEINNQLGIASGLSTNLNTIKNLDQVLAAKPAQLRVSLSGASKETYEITHTGGRYDKVRKNLDKLAEINKKYGNKTLIEVYFHLYKHNLHEIKKIRSICDLNGFNFHPSLAILFHDYVKEYIDSGIIPKAALPANELMLIDIDTLIDDCKKQDHMNCILTRVVPVINWDMSVLACCTYAPPGIHKSYLELSMDELLSKRVHSETCGKCQSQSLHRWNDQIYYSKFIEQVVKKNN